MRQILSRIWGMDLTLPADDDTQKPPAKLTEIKTSLQYLFTETVKTVPEIFNGTEIVRKIIHTVAGGDPPLQVHLANVTDRSTDVI